MVNIDMTLIFNGYFCICNLSVFNTLYLLYINVLLYIVDMTMSDKIIGYFVRHNHLYNYHT